MKELTIKEKAEAYDKAIEAARCIYNNMKDGGNFGGMEDLEVIFPELKENGDERIRKAIGYAIGQSTHSDGTLINGVSSEEALAWIEKQRQVRCTGIGKKEETGTLKKMLDDEEMKTLLRTEYEKGKADAIAEGYKWSEEDAQTLQDIINDLSEELNEETDEEEQKILSAKISFLNSLKPRPIHEWSREDNRIRLEITNFLECQKREEPTRAGILNKWIAWIAKLEPQWKQKPWSEEDERKLTDVIVALSEYANGNIPYILPSILLEDVDWLKSISPQSQWKPSDTEINILQGVIDGSFKPENVKVTLTNILEHLKKLKG